MTADAHGAAEFYRTSRGAVTARLLRARIAALWPDMAGCSVLGIGYTAPYLRTWDGVAYRRIALTPAQIGAIRWPPIARTGGELGTNAPLSRTRTASSISG